MEYLLDSKVGIIESTNSIRVIGHRVVHGGEFFSTPQKINHKILEQIKSVAHLAPLHNPANIKGIEVAQKLFPKAAQVAVFDTAFHQTIPEKVFRYAIPEKFYTEENIRVYGMHGTSHQYITKNTAKYLNKDIDKTSLISIHLGNGCSIAAVKKGQCIDTSMGFSPLAGLVMGTRCGDIDPAVLLYLNQNLGYSTEDINTILNKESGLKGLTGTNDLRDILENAAKGDEKSTLAIDIYTYRIKKYIGSYIASLGQLPDAIVFTGGVGENASIIRAKVLSDLQHLGIQIEQEKNDVRISGNKEFQETDAPIKLLVIPTNEELEIAQQSYSLIQHQIEDAVFL